MTVSWRVWWPVVWHYQPLEVLEVLDTPDFWLKLLCALSIVIFSAGLDC